MPISFYPPDASDFPFVANESRLQRLDQRFDQSADQRLEVPTFPQEPPTDPIMPPAGRRRTTTRRRRRRRTSLRRFQSRIRRASRITRRSWSDVVSSWTRPRTETFFIDSASTLRVRVRRWPSAPREAFTRERTLSMTRFCLASAAALLVAAASAHAQNARASRAARAADHHPERRPEAPVGRHQAQSRRGGRKDARGELQLQADAGRPQLRGAGGPRRRSAVLHLRESQGRAASFRARQHRKEDG